jgi:fructose-1-phosphate kinase PfkB-like protein
MAFMKSAEKQLTEQEIDKIVESQAEDDSAWKKPIQVRRSKPTSLSIPSELAARAAFLAKLHREKDVEEWLRKVIKERVELEEVAFNEAKREMSLRNGV